MRSLTCKRPPHFVQHSGHAALGRFYKIRRHWPIEMRHVRASLCRAWRKQESGTGEAPMTINEPPSAAAYIWSLTTHHGACQTPVSKFPQVSRIQNPQTQQHFTQCTSIDQYIMHVLLTRTFIYRCEFIHYWNVKAFDKSTYAQDCFTHAQNLTKQINTCCEFFPNHNQASSIFGK